uniref:Uncharacterized protein n=1 Tax=uncultured Chromatiales bacterium HF0200_41F04 TaxID=710740 RepID=E0XV42_9GAMM|nr:hypothetical protein [uncultured Chromatiales bacterium HF0200_41F04]
MYRSCGCSTPLRLFRCDEVNNPLRSELKDVGSSFEGVLHGRGAFCKPVKVCCEACWRYQKCEC